MKKRLLLIKEEERNWLTPPRSASKRGALSPLRPFILKKWSFLLLRPFYSTQ